MKNEKHLIFVVAVALVNDLSQVLLQKRPESGPMAGLWEFPGGKVESGESPEAALVRELAEELGITVDSSQITPLTFASEPLGERHLVLLLYLCRDWKGEPQPLHATELQWVVPSAMHNLAMPPADVPLVTALTQALATNQ